MGAGRRCRDPSELWWYIRRSGTDSHEPSGTSENKARVASATMETALLSLPLRHNFPDILRYDLQVG